MSKEYLEALETIKDMLIGNGCNNSINDYADSLILPIKQALQRLESIDNAEPSKALEELDSGFEVHTKEYGNMIAYGEEQVDIIQQALLKAQEQEKKNAKYEVVKKALKNGIYAKDPLDENKLNYIPAVALSNVETEWYLSNHSDFCVNIKDYKTLFWLKEDKSE